MNEVAGGPILTAERRDGVAEITLRRPALCIVIILCRPALCIVITLCRRALSGLIHPPRNQFRNRLNRVR